MTQSRCAFPPSSRAETAPPSSSGTTSSGLSTQPTCTIQRPAPHGWESQKHLPLSGADNTARRRTDKHNYTASDGLRKVWMLLVLLQERLAGGGRVECGKRLKSSHEIQAEWLSIHCSQGHRRLSGRVSWGVWGGGGVATTNCLSHPPFSERVE
jgi:hypothetical protein